MRVGRTSAETSAGTRAGRCAGLLGCALPVFMMAIAMVGAHPVLATQPLQPGVIAERPVPAPVRIERQPHHAVRMLGALQERIAHGDEAAVALQKAVVLEISQELKTYPLEVWKSVRNRQSLIKYALSGGDPEQLQLVLARRLFPEDERALAQAALAYAEGNRSVVLRLIDKVDVYELPPSLAGHVALVKAIVVANTDLARVVRLSDDARLLSPGTLVEETALRLAIEATVTQGDQAKFEAITLRYFRRFPRSPFLAAVIRPVARAIAEGGYSERPEGARWVQAVVQYLDPNKLVLFYSSLAEAGLRSSKLATTTHAARMAQRYARRGSTEEAWAIAYEGSALVIGSDRALGLARLAAAEATAASDPVHELIASARSVAKLIEQPPMALSVAEASPVADEQPRAQAAPPILTQKATPDPARAPGAAPVGGTPAATNALARMALVDKLLKEIDE